MKSINFKSIILLVAMSVAMISCDGGNNSSSQESTSDSQESVSNSKESASDSKESASDSKEQTAKNTQNQDPKLQGLPQQVIDYVQKNYPNAKVENIDSGQDGDNGMFYEIRFEDGTEIVFDSKFQVIRTSDPSRE